MRVALLLALCCGFFAGFCAAQSSLSPTDPCNITPDALQSAMLEANKLRSVCEYSGFTSPVCSNYWAQTEQVRILSAKFQRCLENTASSFRGWVYGDQNLQIAGAFDYAGALDRIALGEAQTAVQSEVDQKYGHNTDVENAAKAVSLEEFSELKAQWFSDTLTEVDVQSQAVQTTTNREASATRTQDVSSAGSIRANTQTEEATTRSLHQATSSTEQTLTSTLEESDRANNALEFNNTRSQKSTEAKQIRDLTTKEETNTRNEEDFQSAATRSYHQQVLSTTQSIIETELYRQASSTLANNRAEAKATSDLANLNKQQTQTTVLQQENQTSTTISQNLQTQESLTTSLAQSAAADVAQVEGNQQSGTRSQVDTTVAQVTSADATGKSSVQATYAAAQSSTISQQTSTNSNINSLFSNSTLPTISSTLAGLTPILNTESTYFLTIMIHFNLASTGDSFCKRFALVDIFTRPENYFNLTQTIAHSTVTYWAQQTPSASGNSRAASLLSQGDSQASNGNYNNAVNYYRSAYIAATTGK